MEQSAVLGGMVFFSGQSMNMRSPAQRIHIGSQTNTWGAPIKSYDHLLSILDALINLGYTGFETSYKSLDSEAERAAQCRKAFESRHIRFVASHCGVSLADKTKHTEETASVLRIAHFTAEMGASAIIVSGRKLPQIHGKLDLDAAHVKAEGLNHMAAACKKEGLKLCYHNHLEEFRDEPSEMSILLNDTDPGLVWFNYDIGNAYPLGPDAADFSAQHFSRIAIYHIKDMTIDKKGNQVATDLGRGKINLPGVVAPLLKGNWEGWLVIERNSSYPNPAAHPEELLRQCLEYVKELLTAKAVHLGHWSEATNSA